LHSQQILSVVVAVSLSGALGALLLLWRTALHARQLRGAAWSLQTQCKALEAQLTSERSQREDAQVLAERNAFELRQADVERTELRKLVESLRSTRGEIVRRVYSIVTIGMSQSGKTALTLKWASPLFQANSTLPTQFQRYERTVSRQTLKGAPPIEHVFEIRDWGGEHMGNALHDVLRMDNVNGLLMVVDLGRIDSTPEGRRTVVFDEQRIKEQIDAFHPASLRYFFTDHILSHCKSFVLFINKSDALAGQPEEVEARAMALYQPLIDSLRKFSRDDGMIDITVMVGSALSGHNTHNLFAHFIEKILPVDSYDPQLLHMIQTEVASPGEARGGLAAGAVSTYQTVAPAGAPGAPQSLAQPRPARAQVPL
jgi:hypothetical protein